MTCEICEKPIGDRKAYTTNLVGVFHPTCWINRQFRALDDAEAQNERYRKSIAITDANFRRLQNERDEWKRRAEAHGCNVVEGDEDCG